MTGRGSRRPLVGRRGLLAGLSGALVASPARLFASAPALVMVLPVLHGRHAANPRYSYGDIYETVSKFGPDLVGVEIRQEDMDASDEYLHHNYPEEMIHLARVYGDRAFGFDWLGDELAGRPIPDDWWTKQSEIKALEREMNAEPAVYETDARTKALGDQLDALIDQQDEIVGRSTASSLADGPYDRVTADYYRTLDQLTAGTRFSLLPHRYAERDQNIAANVVGKVRSCPGQRIAIVTGANHHGPVTAALSELGAQATLAAVP